MKLDPNLESEAAIFKALGHPSRLLMVKALAEDKRCVYELQQIVGSDLSTISKHLSVLKNAGVVKSTKRGNNVLYELTFPCLKQVLGCLGKCTERCDNCC